MKYFLTKSALVIGSLYVLWACTLDHHLPRTLPTVQTKELVSTEDQNTTNYTFFAHVISKGTIPHQEVGIVYAPKQQGVLPDISHARLIAASGTVDDLSDNPVTVPEETLAGGMKNGQTREFNYRTYVMVQGGDVVYGNVFEGEIKKDVPSIMSKAPKFEWNTDGSVTFTIDMEVLGTEKITGYGIVYQTSPLDLVNNSIYNNGVNPTIEFTDPIQPGVNTKTIPNPFAAVPADHKIHSEIYIQYSGGTVRYRSYRGVQPSRP